MFHRISEIDAGLTRRQLLHVAGALTVGATLGRSWLAAAESDAPLAVPQHAATSDPGTKAAPIMQMGVLQGTFGRGTLEQRLDGVKACGLECAQVSLDCAGLPAMPDEIPPGLAGRIRREAATRGITIAAVQGTFNMSHPDNDSPAAWRDMAACVREATDIARQAGVVLAFEPEVNNVVDSARKARRLLDEIGSPHLKVTIDPANIFHAGELPRMREILEEAFVLVGKDIVLAHAKDLDHDGDAGHKAAGQGKLDYDRYLALLHTGGFKGPLLLHGLSEAQVPGCVAFLREKLARAASVPADK